MSSRFQSKSQSGFTLIELMISIAILAFISLGIYEAVTGTFKLRDELNADGDFYTGIRLAMGVMNHDITLLYSPLIMMNQPGTNPSPGPSAAPAASAASASTTTAAAAFETSAELAQSSTFWSAAADKSGLRPSRFQGKSEKITFISASNYRIYRDSPESEFTKVTYEIVRDDEPPVNGFKADSSNILRRGVNPDVFDGDDIKDRDNTHLYTMLRGVVKGEFAFYRWQDNKLERYTSWDSDTDDFKNQIPDIIEFVFNLKGASQLSFDGNYRFKPEIPVHGIFPSF